MNDEDDWIAVGNGHYIEVSDLKAHLSVGQIQELCHIHPTIDRRQYLYDRGIEITPRSELP